MDYEREGFLPQAMLNCLVRLGWSHGDQEIYSPRGAVAGLFHGQPGSSAAVFDRDKLLWLNAHYIKETPDPELAAMLGDFLGRMGRPGADAAYLERIVPLLKPRAQTLVEMAEKAMFFVVPDAELGHDHKAVEKCLTSEAKGHLAALWELFKTVDPFDQPGLERAVQGYLDATGVKFKLLAQPIRVAITGTTASPGLFETMEVLGRDRVLARMERALAL
jgi:glutamyl-tRNA synthetase